MNIVAVINLLAFHLIKYVELIVLYRFSLGGDGWFSIKQIVF